MVSDTSVAASAEQSIVKSEQQSADIVLENGDISDSDVDTDEDSEQ